MSQFEVGCGPLQWYQFKSKAPDEWPEERILREVAQSGFAGIAAGPRSGQTPTQLMEYLASFGLKPAPGYFGGDWWLFGTREKAIEDAKRIAEFSAAMGVYELFVSAGGFGSYTSRRNGKNRAQLAGQVQPEDGLTDDEWQIMADTLNAIGAETLQSGVSICYHNHVGAVVETRAEMDRLLSITDANTVFLGPDTGHLAWAGADVVQFFRDYAPRIKTAHLKDMNPAVREEGVVKEWDYNQFSDAGIWCELGEGSIDFAAMFDILREQNFNGWMISETDVTQKSTPLESGTINRNYLKSLGI